MDPALTNFYVNSGGLSFQENTGSAGGPIFSGGGFGWLPAGSSSNVASNAYFGIYELSNHATKTLVLQGGATFTNENGICFWSGPVTTTGSNTIAVTGSAAGSYLEVDGQINGSGGTRQDRWNAPGSCRCSRSLYTRPTWVRHAGTLILTNTGSGDASISTSSAITNNGSTIDVSALSTSTLTTPTTQILSGSGTIDGSLVVNGVFAPGTVTNQIGTRIRAVTNNVTIAGTAATFVSISGATNTFLTTSGTASSIQSSGGTLTVTNVGGNLKSGNTFLLFQHGNGVYSGLTFSAPTLPVLGPGLSWNNTIASNGKIAVTGTLTPPTITSTSVTGRTLSMSGSGGIPKGQYVLLSALNITNKLSTWTKLQTNVYTGVGGFSLTYTNATNSQQYFTISE